MIEKRNNATTTFFEKVKTDESNPLTPKLLIKIENPEIIAVRNTNNNPALLLFRCTLPPLSLFL